MDAPIEPIHLLSACLLSACAGAAVTFFCLFPVLLRQRKQLCAMKRKSDDAAPAPQEEEATLMQQTIIQRLHEMTMRLAVAGGDVRASGLRVTTIRLCECHTTMQEPPFVRGEPWCKECGGNGFIRTVCEPRAEDN